MCAVLLAVAGAYTAYWFVVAGRIEGGVVEWSQARRADKIDISWQKLEVSGFPAAFRVAFAAAALHDGSVRPSPELHIPILSGTARPWDLADWRLAAPEGFTGDLAHTGAPATASLAVHTADGVATIEGDGGWKLWLAMQGITLEAGSRVQISSAQTTFTVPPGVLRGDAMAAALAVDASRVKLPGAVGPLGDTIDELDFGATVKGNFPSGKLADAAAAWRDAGGRLELDHLRLNWGSLGATATGTIALDQELQPIGGFSGAVQGYDQILAALVQNGQMRAADAGLARIALTMLAKAGPDGKPEIKTAFTIQNGQMFLGPARLGKAPRLTWE
ncbi:MAG: DUF2125 domain-containing protein [Alphaproteobacteria bacterium]|nr:DUF2125 domain-containing protein [Alphaproteobacteria bacterium]